MPPELCFSKCCSRTRKGTQQAAAEAEDRDRTRSRRTLNATPRSIQDAQGAVVGTDSPHRARHRGSAHICLCTPHVQHAPLWRPSRANWPARPLRATARSRR